MLAPENVAKVLATIKRIVDHPKLPDDLKLQVVSLLSWPENQHRYEEVMEILDNPSEKKRHEGLFELYRKWFDEDAKIYGYERKLRHKPSRK